MTTTALPHLRCYLALAAASALLLTGCGDRTSDTGSAAEPSPSDTASPTPTAATSAAATKPTDGEGGPLTDFPLTTGWPDRPAEPEGDGIVYPVDASDPDAQTEFSTYTCGVAAPTVEDAEVARARYDSVEDYRNRTLLVLADADAAVAHLAALRAFYEACDTQSGDDGYTYPVVVTDTEVGGDSFGVVRLTEREGNPTIGIYAQHLVRVGRSILVESVSNEGGGGPEDVIVEVREQLDRMIVDSADVVAAQCAFTEAGC